MAHLLLVEDDHDVGEILADMLGHEGHVVRTAHDGEEGMRALGTGPVDAVVLDVEMPVLDGPGMAHRMLIENCGLEQIPVILVSGVVDLPRVAASVGTPYYLAKPFSLPDLLQMIERAVRERVAPGQASLSRIGPDGR